MARRLLTRIGLLFITAMTKIKLLFEIKDVRICICIQHLSVASNKRVFGFLLCCFADAGLIHSSFARYCRNTNQVVIIIIIITSSLIIGVVIRNVHMHITIIVLWQHTDINLTVIENKLSVSYFNVIKTNEVGNYTIFSIACFLVNISAENNLTIQRRRKGKGRRRRARVQIAVATLSGNSLRQTVHTHCASVHQAVKLVALLKVARVTADLAESNGSLPPGL